MNEITFVEAARMLAERVMREGGTTPRERIAHGFRLALARFPSEQEIQILAQGFERHAQRFAADPAAADKLLQLGEAPADRRLDASQLAAYAAVMNLILNLDEAVNRE